MSDSPPFVSRSWMEWCVSKDAMGVVRAAPRLSSQSHGRRRALPVALLFHSLAMLSLGGPSSVQGQPRESGATSERRGPSFVEPTRGEHPALSLSDAVGQVLASHPSAQAARAAVREARARAREVRAQLLPRIDFEQSITRGNHPVFAFGTRLTQQRFAADDLALDALNHPAALTDHQSRLTAQVPLIHAPGWLGVRAARLRGDAAEAQARSAQATLVFATIEAYFGLQLASQGVTVAEGSAASAHRDAAQVQALQQAGMATEVATLRMEVAASAAEEQALTARHQVAVARAGLNSLLGQPLDTRQHLTTALDGGAEANPEGAVRVEGQRVVETRVVEQRAVETREPNELPDLGDHPEVEAARRERQAARAALQAARLRWLPVLVLYGDLQSHRPSLSQRGGESWTVGIALRINLFAGLGDLSRAQAQRAMHARAEAMVRQAEDGVRLQIRQAHLALESANARATLSARTRALAAEAMRQESGRLQEGMSDTAAWMRSRSAEAGAEFQYLHALYTQRLAAARLALALGQLDRCWRRGEGPVRCGEER